MKKNKQPLVSVIITAYNAAPYIGQAIQSIINQTYHRMEILIVDDGSTDGTYEVLQQYQHIDTRIKIFRLAKNSGPNVASNFLLKKAKSTLIARMDADDIAFRDRIEKQVAFLQEHPGVIIVGGQCVLIDEKNTVIGEKRYPLTHAAIYPALFTFNVLQHPACMINTKLLPKRILFYQGKSLLAHDLELLFVLAQYGKLANLSDTVLYYRQHNTSLSLKHPKKTFFQTLLVREKAVTQYGYTPTFTRWAMHYVQKAIISLLPEKVIYPLFRMIRMKKKHYHFTPIIKLNALLHTGYLSATLNIYSMLLVLSYDI